MKERLFKLTRGTVSIIRKDKAGIDKATADGFKLDGEVNKDYEVINASPQPHKGKK